MKHKTTRLGILGGMGPQATLAFYQRVLDMTDAHQDQAHLPALIWSDTQVPDRTQAILSGETDRVYGALLEGARLLEREGCTALAIPCNTSHFFVDRLQGQLGVPILNMVTLAAQAAAGRKKVAVLATDGTVKTGIYQRALPGSVVPDAGTQARIMALIYDVVKAGRRGAPELWTPIHGALADMGCDGAILACTELSVFRLSHGLPPFYIDAMDELARASVTACGYPLRQSTPPAGA